MLHTMPGDCTGKHRGIYRKATMYGDSDSDSDSDNLRCLKCIAPTVPGMDNKTSN